MELHKLKKIIDKYGPGAASRAEEELKLCFEKNGMPANFKPYRFIFGFFKIEKEKCYESKIQLQTHNWVNRNKYVGIVTGIILIVGLFFFQQKYIEMGKSNLGTIQDREEALHKSMETLKMVSKYMNEGKENFIYLKEFNHTKNKFIKVK